MANQCFIEQMQPTLQLVTRDFVNLPRYLAKETPSSSPSPISAWILYSVYSAPAIGSSRLLQMSTSFFFFCGPPARKPAENGRAASPFDNSFQQLLAKSSFANAPQPAPTPSQTKPTGLSHPTRTVIRLGIGCCFPHMRDGIPSRSSLNYIIGSMGLDGG